MFAKIKKRGQCNENVSVTEERHSDRTPLKLGWSWAYELHMWQSRSWAHSNLQKLAHIKREAEPNQWIISTRNFWLSYYWSPFFSADTAVSLQHNTALYKLHTSALSNEISKELSKNFSYCFINWVHNFVLGQIHSYPKGYRLNTLGRYQMSIKGSCFKGMVPRVLLLRGGGTFKMWGLLGNL